MQTNTAPRNAFPLLEAGASGPSVLVAQSLLN